MKRLHISFNGERTTVAVDNTLSALLAIKLGHEPETPEAWRAVREWLQERLPAKHASGVTGGPGASATLRHALCRSTILRESFDDLSDVVVLTAPYRKQNMSRRELIPIPASVVIPGAQIVERCRGNNERIQDDIGHLRPLAHGLGQFRERFV